MPRLRPLSPDGIVGLVQRTHQPVMFKHPAVAKGSEVAPAAEEPIPITLPKDVAKIYLGVGEYGLPDLRGISMTPLVEDAGHIRTPSGYDEATGLWCVATPKLDIPVRPTWQEAKEAFHRRREAVATVPFADASTVRVDGTAMVNLNEPPGEDESAFHNASAIAVLRSSLRIAPGLLITAPQGNGAGSGKGKAAKFITVGAYGVPADANTGGHDSAEFEKRLTADLAEGAAAIQYDNMNDRVLKSNQLAVALSEESSKARILGKTANVRLQTRVFVVITGNALSVGEDLARRFIQVRLDPRVENPELRNFKRDLIPGDGAAHQKRFLEDWLTIIRWGCQNRDRLPTGKAFGYPEWCLMVRDPLLALGCTDPVDGAQRGKQSDPERVEKVELFEAWWKHHGDQPVTAAELLGGNGTFTALLDPHGRGRQWVASRLIKMAGSRIAGFELTTSRVGHWSATTYRMRLSEAEPRETREDGGEALAGAPIPPKPRTGPVGRENGSIRTFWRAPEYIEQRRAGFQKRYGAPRA